MEKTPPVLIANQRVQRSRPAPRLRLLIELEPRRRVFLRNLGDLLLARQLPQIAITSRPAPFWNDVFVRSGPRWSSFFESILCHLLLLVLFVWGQSKVWVSVKLFPSRDAAHNSITYYPLPTFPSAQGRAPSARARSRLKQRPAQQSPKPPAMPVTPQHKPSLVTPPDIKQAAASMPNLSNSHTVTPMVPFSATANPLPKALAGSSSAIAPPPRVDQATARRLALAQASSPVAPAPDLAGPSTGRALKAANTDPQVIPPPPSVQDADKLGAAGRSVLLTRATNVVPPPPSVQAAGNAAGNLRLGSMARAGVRVVPPPPSVQGADNSNGTGRLSSLSATKTDIVPPPPADQGAGNGAAGTRLGSLSASSDVIAPPPSVNDGANSGTTGRLGSLSGNASEGSQIVPPPPSMDGTAGSAGGRLGSMAANRLGNGSPVVSPPSSIGGAGRSGATGRLQPMDPLPADTASSEPAANNENKTTYEELPLGLLGVVFAPPGSSFFSNFEVFVVKRRIGKGELQIIKLVYEFLPYQRRLSEYDLSKLPPRVIKLRVTADPSCDEPLGEVIQGHPDPTRPANEYPQIPAALRSYPLNTVLPCYRTTAGDFQKAMSRAY